MASTTASTSAATGQDDVAAGAGTTTIVDGVVAKIVGIAVREVPGVHDLGNGAARAIGAIRSAVGQQDRSQGVSVEVGEKQVAADITLVAEHPVPLQDLSDKVRSRVGDAIASVVGLEVAEINVTVTDVHISSDDSDEQAGSRVE